MYDQAPDIECEWKETANGNHVCIHEDDLVATVHRKHDHEAWRIVINIDGTGHVVDREAFSNSDEAISRASDILDGANCVLLPVNPLAAHVVTDWKMQKKKSNGSPTYGRKYEDISVSVKKASSGKWFYVTYSGSRPSPAQGWFDSAEEAMQAFDNRHS